MKFTNKKVAESMQDGITRRVRTRALALNETKRLILKFEILKKS